jgi:DNA-binding LytR/AlgR family response regulator
VVVKQKVLLKRYEAAARETEALVTVTKAPAQVGLIKLIGTNRNEELQIEPERLLLLTASDNYVEIFFIEAVKIKKQLFRNTLKTMESAMSNQPQFYRCHKAHIVNLKKVIHVSGNAQGLKLEIEGLSELVPVSRNLTTQIKERLKQI